MKFTFLGTGTSAGIPAIACDCNVCTSADPRDRRMRCAASVDFVDPEGNQRTILIDAGPDLRHQALANNITRLDAILFTHNHVDHTFGLDEVRRFNAVMRQPIEIYADDHTMKFLQRIYRHIFDASKNVNDSFVATLVPRRVDPELPIELHGLRFTPINLLHGKLPVLGYRIEPVDERKSRQVADPWWPLAYLTDVSAIPTESWQRLTGLRTLVIDALRYRRHPTHLTIPQAVSIAERINADKTWFIHMSHDVSHAKAETDLPESIRLAYDGLILD